MLQVVVHMRCGVDSVTQEDEVRRTRTRAARGGQQQDRGCPSPSSW